MKSKSINVKEASFPDFSAGDNTVRKPSEDYTDLLMNVPLDVRVEIGKAKLRMREVLSLAQGSIIRLEKQAGAPVEIIANDQTVARGDVIVIDDNFGVRITEIISSKKFVKEAEKAAEEKIRNNFTESAPEVVTSHNEQESEEMITDDYAEETSSEENEE
ncbi:MAG: flagellar motor switch protein FliN [Oscillospiraceae bacterium]|nr:flagellar motor switch protein FliN [Oscillospiraceae bacterium]